MLLTSSNYNDLEKKVTGGRNGYGAKLANIFSTEFTVETQCAHTLMHTRTHTRMHTRTHTRMYTTENPVPPLSLRAHLRARTWTCTHARTLAHTRARVRHRALARSRARALERTSAGALERLSARARALTLPLANPPFVDE